MFLLQPRLKGLDISNAGIPEIASQTIQELDGMHISALASNVN